MLADSFLSPVLVDERNDPIGPHIRRNGRSCQNTLTLGRQPGPLGPQTDPLESLNGKALNDFLNWIHMLDSYQLLVETAIKVG